MKRRKIFLFILLHVLSTGISSQKLSPAKQYDDSFDVQRIAGIVYGQVGEHRLLLDLFLPENEVKARTAILLFHGGGWAHGSRYWTNGWANLLAQRGYVCASVEYRLSDQTIYPAAVEDAKCAVRWLRANARKYGVDPNKIAAFGGSAGAHLSAILGTTDTIQGEDEEGCHRNQSSRVNAVIGLSGPYDLRVMDPDTDGGVIPKFLGGSLEDLPEIYAEASPITHVDKSSAPVLMVHAVDDAVVPYEQVELFSKELRLHGVSNEIYKVASGGHNFTDSDEKVMKVIEAIDDFLSRHFDK